jgi:chromate transport protein ChrA
MIALVVPPMCILIVVGALYERITGVVAVRGALNGLSAAAAGLLLVMFYGVLRTLVRSRPAVTIPVALTSFAVVVTGALSVPLALLALGPVSVALAWFRRP